MSADAPTMSADAPTTWDPAFCRARVVEILEARQQFWLTWELVRQKFVRNVCIDCLSPDHMCLCGDPVGDAMESEDTESALEDLVRGLKWHLEHLEDTALCDYHLWSHGREDACHHCYLEDCDCEESDGDL